MNVYVYEIKEMERYEEDVWYKVYIYKIYTMKKKYNKKTMNEQIKIITTKKKK